MESTVHDVVRRDRVLRAYLAGRDWDAAVELRLVRELVAASSELLPEHPYLFDYEWEVKPGDGTGGRGDLVFTDGSGRYAVVEVKSIEEGSGQRTNRRTHVEDQAEKHAQGLKARLPADAVVEAWVYTDDYIYGGLRSASGPRQAGRVRLTPAG